MAWVKVFRSGRGGGLVDRWPRNLEIQDCSPRLRAWGPYREDRDFGFPVSVDQAVQVRNGYILPDHRFGERLSEEVEDW